ncbi:hypothetical protein [uncultured Kriegella sp.]|uniref:MORN repeat-containing protein n=1 Tax=uncultured Kriegella sp. TaxID=1798910 RepID=UPI0030D78555|tara:strand:- start:7572 stop:8423 length:852 start_codon:yes stop_codon:yes gene_type:complete
MKKRTIILYLLLATSVVTALFFLFRTQGLKQQLKETELKQTRLEVQVDEHKKLMRIDSMLVDGNYNSALREYTFQLENKLGNDSIGLQLRIALAENLKRMEASNNTQIDSLALKALDSLQETSKVTPREIRQYDSVSFALEKMKVQLQTMQRQQRKKSFGEYLRFKSQKGNQLHYVGQVQNKKANGYGIALFDTGSRYEGQWKDNQRHGEGTFYWPDGEYYIGSYINDRRNGNGTYYWPNKEKYAGQWKDDKRNGQGTFYGADGKVVTSGVWKNDKLQKPNKE